MSLDLTASQLVCQGPVMDPWLFVVYINELAVYLHPKAGVRVGRVPHCTNLSRQFLHVRHHHRARYHMVYEYCTPVGGTSLAYYCIGIAMKYGPNGL